MLAPKDEFLMMQYQQGEYAAFEQLYQRYCARVYSFIRNRIRNKEAADDLFQLTFQKLHQSRATYLRKYPFAHWVFVIARSVLVDFWRAERATTPLDSLPEAALAKSPSQDEWSDSQLSAETQAALHSLGPADLRIARLRFLDESTYEEIATLLNCTETSARKKVSRALTRLRLAAFSRSDRSSL